MGRADGLTAPNMISLRDWFAGQALVGLAPDDQTWGYIAAACYAAADAMLAARERPRAPEPDPDAAQAVGEREAAAMADGMDEDRERAEAASSMGETVAALREMREARAKPCPGCSSDSYVAACRRRLGNCPVCGGLAVTGQEPLVLSGPGGGFRTEHRACACCKALFTAVAGGPGRYCQECIERRGRHAAKCVGQDGGAA